MDESFLNLKICNIEMIAIFSFSSLMMVSVIYIGPFLTLIAGIVYKVIKKLQSVVYIHLSKPHCSV